MIPDIKPLAALTLAGASFTREGSSRLVTPCPCCGSKMSIAYEAFFCDNTGCQFSRGGSLDYLALELGGYDEAIEMASQVSPHFKHAGPSEAKRHRIRRNILDFFIRVENKIGMTDVERLVLKNQFTSSSGVDYTAFPKGHLYLTEKESNELVLLLAQADLDPPPNLQGRACVVVPYWAYPHILSHLVVVNPKTNNIRSCEVYPHRYAWFGLAQKDLSCDRMDVYPNYIEAMRNERALKIKDPYSFPTHLFVNPRRALKGLCVDNLRFHGNMNTWYKHLARWSFIETFPDSIFVDELAGNMTLKELMGHLLMDASHEDDFEDYLDLCGAMHMDPVTRSHLLVLVDGMTNRNRANRLQKTLTRRLIEQSDKYSLYESAEGYDLETSTEKKQLSNFTLNFTSLVAFSALSQIHYQGSFAIGGIPLEFDLPAKALDTPQALEKALQQIQALNTSPQIQDAPLVTIYNRQGFQRVLSWLKNEASELQRSRGIKTLGWTRRCDFFYTPDAVVSAEGIHTGVSYYPDEDGDHHCYRSGNTQPTIPEAMPQLDPVLTEILSALVAQMIRYYHGHKVRPIAVVNNVEGRAWGLRLMQGFGQTRLLRLTNITPRNLELNRGMPCIMSGVNELQAKRIHIAGLWLAEKGYDLDGVTEEQINSVASFLPSMIQELARRILSGELKSYREKRSVNLTNGSALEGADVIRQEFWAGWPKVGVTWSAIDTLLGEREKELVTAVTVNVQDDTVIIPDTLWKGLGFNRADLILELEQLCHKLDRGQDGRNIVADRNSMFSLLGDFYGEVPKLATV